MKKFYLFFILKFFIPAISIGQTTGMNFQGVARNPSGIVLASQKISLKFSIISSSTNGNVDYVETRLVNTNSQGVFSVVIGDNDVVYASGSFSNIDWKQFPKYLKVEMDPNAGIAFTTMGTTQIQSVPYSKYSSFAEVADAGSLSGSTLKSTITGSSLTSVGTLTNLTVTNPIVGSITGNAATTSKLAIPRNINGVAFDGSGDINITTVSDAGSLAGTTLKSTITGSSLTSVGTLTNLTVTNPIVGSITGNAATATFANTASNANTSSVASKLATPRNINGVTFDGSGDITITADAGSLSGTTLKSTITGSSLTSVGTLTNLTVTNPIVGSITGNAATANSAGNITATSNTSLTALTNLATVGTITTGVWSGTAISVANGGTGLTNPGTSGNVLTSNGTSWISSTISGFVDLTTNQVVEGSKSFISNVRIGTQTQTSSAALEVNSVTQGFLPPRMSRSQRDLISSPATGLMIFCIDCTPKGEPEFYNGIRWTTLAPVLLNNSITIGDQTWTSVNLNVSRYNNGDIIPQVTDQTEWANLTTGAWCYYNNDANNGATYGKMYNWYAVNDPRGIAPLGWHIPSDEEWTILTDYLGGSTVAGGDLKQSGTSLWNSPNTGATNASGFNALPGGTRGNDGSFSTIGTMGIWWSTSQSGINNIWTRDIQNFSTNVTRNFGEKKRGIYVRCIKD
jgi:uncharacterized protein (TIGR02145 family)